MKQLLSAALLSGSILSAYAQEGALIVTPQRRDDKSVELTYSKSAPGNYTIVFNFTDLTNTYPPAEVHNVNAAGGSVFTLKPTDKEKHIDYRFAYRYVRGRLNPRVERDFCYVLPYKPATTCVATEAGFVNERYFGAERSSDWKSYFFYTENETMVTAIRKGTVVEITEKYEHDPAAEFTTNANSILVEHEDGTLVRYRGFKKGTLKVNVGDVVFPNSPLGMNTATSKSRFGVSVLVFYLASVDFASLQGQTLANPKRLYAIITPKFSVENGSCIVLENRKEYQSFSNDEIVKKEMSRKEQKRYKENTTP